MANWSAYKEAEIGLPVYKRAKHGIHFDAGKGLIKAEFVGKPAHWFDGKEWKAIDTKPLLRKDGSYGCPHSDVIIKPDGTVTVGEYAQKAALISPQALKVDGDRLVREFTGGRQYLYITENGFRQEIVLEKMPDLKKVSSLIDTVSGILPSKYTASALSLKDSSTAELSDYVQVDSKSLASVLEAAKYPVVIDPDFGSGVGTSMLTDSATNYATARAANPWNITTDGSTYGATFGNFRDADKYRQQRALLKFDTSSIGSGGTITQVNVKLTGTGNRTGISLYIVFYDWSAYDPVTSSNDQSAFGGMTGVSGEEGFTQVLTSGTTSANLTTTFVSKTGTSYFGITGAQDYGETETNDASSPGIAATGNATAAYRPVLSVTYTAAASGNPFYYFRQQQ